MGLAWAFAVLSCGGPLSFSLCTYSVRMMKNWPVEFVISFRTFRAAPGAALKETSTTLRSIKFGVGVPPGFAVVATLCPGAGVGLAMLRVLPATGDGEMT